MNYQKLIEEMGDLDTLVNKIILIVIILLLSGFSLFSQTDSVVTYINDVSTYKVIYDENFTLFYKKDSLNNWYMYAKWEDTDTERLYYMEDSITGDLVVKWTNEWSDSIQYSYNSDGELSHYSIHYGYKPILTEITSGKEYYEDNIILYQDGQILNIKSINTINEIRVYDQLGMLIMIKYPNSTNVNMILQQNKVFIIRLKIGNDYFTKKIIMT